MTDLGQTAVATANGELLTRRRAGKARKRGRGVLYMALLGLAGPLAIALAPDSEHIFWEAIVLLAATVSGVESGLPAAPYRPALVVLPLLGAATIARTTAMPFLLVLAAVAIAACWAIRREHQRVLRQWGTAAEAGAGTDVEAGAAAPQARQNPRTDESHGARLLAEVSHDLRQPVQALVAQVDLIADNPAHISPRQFKEIHASVNTLAEMLNDLLDVNRVNMGIYKAALQPVNVRLVLQEVEQVFAAEAHAKGLRFLVECPNEVWIKSDQRLLRRILFNLTANAIRYTDTGGIRISCLLVEGRALLQTEDTGRGMSVADLGAKVAEVKSRPTTSDRGLGLGLGIVSAMASQLGHKLRALSEIGEGTQIEVDLGECMDAASLGAHAGDRVPPAASDILVAIVEDDSVVLQALVNTFTSWGYCTVSADSSHKLVAQLRHGSATPMLVVTDFKLQARETGLDVVRTVRGMYDEAVIPAVILTGDVFAELEKDAAMAGVRVLYKPVRPSDLRKLVNELVFVSETQLPPASASTSTSTPASAPAPAGSARLGG